jgi:acid phosphatase
MAAVATSLARHGGTATIDLSWYPPNATSINNLTQVIAGSDIYRWVYNNSQVPAEEYGIYNWCNMPHVRKTEYKVPSSEYKLQYVEVVSRAVPIDRRKLTRADPQTSQTNSLCLQLLPCRIISMEL